MKRLIERWKAWTAELRIDALTLYYAYRDPRTPRLARIIAICVAAYAFSPIDLIPDFIPVLGHLDDMVLVPLGILIAVIMGAFPMFRWGMDMLRSAKAGLIASFALAAAVTAGIMLTGAGGAAYLAFMFASLFGFFSKIEHVDILSLKNFYQLDSTTAKIPIQYAEIFTYTL